MNKTSKKILGIAVVILLIAAALVGAGAATEKTVTTELELTNALNDSSVDTIVLGNSIMVSGISVDRTVTLNLKGKILSVKGKILSGTGGEYLLHRSVIYVGPNGNLTLIDTSTDDSGCISAGYNIKGGGIYNEGTIKMYGGSITGNTATESGGGVYNAGTFEMYGGSITGNTASKSGGGVYNEGTFQLTGGSITGNTASEYGGGVYLAKDKTYNRIILGGSAKITENTVGTITNNLYLPDEQRIVISSNSPMSDDALFGVTTEEVTSETGSVNVSYEYDSSISGVGSHFISDVENYDVTELNVTTKLNKLALIPTLKVTVNAGNNGKVKYINDSELKDSITVSNLPSGTEITTSSNTITIGTTTIQAVPDSNYWFSTWENVPQRVITDRTITASFVNNANQITIDTVQNGYFTVDKSYQVSYGATVTITAHPDEGYKFESYNVYKTGDPYTTVTVTDNKFIMPDYPVTVSGKFVYNPHPGLQEVTDDIILTYVLKSDEEGKYYEPVTETITKENIKSFFNTDRIYAIDSPEDIIEIATSNDKNLVTDVSYILTADIDCSGKEMPSIKKASNFHLYGNGHAIINYVSEEGSHGFITEMDSQGEFNNVVMRNCYIKGDDDSVGAFVGCFSTYIGVLSIRGCVLENSTVVSEDGSYVGGFVGKSKAVEEDDKWPYADLNVAGSSVKNCKIVAEGDDVGGILGGATTTTSMENGYVGSKVHVTFSTVENTKVGGYKRVGGILGSGETICIYYTPTFAVNNCIIESSDGLVGGLIGYYNDGRLCCENIGDYPGCSLYLVENTAILSGSDEPGVLVGRPTTDTSFEWFDKQSFIPFYARNCIICGDEKVQASFHKTLDNPVYQKECNVYLSDSKITDYGTKNSYFTVRTSSGREVNATYEDIDDFYIKTERTGEGISKVGIGGHENLVDLKKFGGFVGYYPAYMETVTYQLSTYNYNNRDLTGPVVTTFEYDEESGEKITEPSIVIGKEGYNFNVWYKDEELTEKWNFDEDKIYWDTTLYGERIEKNYNIVYHDGDTVSRENYVGYNEWVQLKILPSTATVRFVGWNTEPDGSGTAYNAGDVVQGLAESGDFNLYPMWKETELISLTFVMNGHGSQVATQEIESGSKFTWPKITVDEGYTFGGWYTCPECTDGNEFNFSITYTTNQIVYAKWTENKYNIVFKANQGTGTMEGISDILYTDTRVLPASEFTKEGYVFAGWNTEPDGSGYSISDNATITKLSSENNDTVILYAQWHPETVTLVLKDGERTLGTMETTYGDKFARPEDPEEEGFTFLEWYCDQGYSTPFDFTQPYTSDQVAYAKWYEHTYSIAFDANQGTGTMDRMADIRYTEYLPLSENTFTRDGYRFIGWNTEPDGSGTFYTDKQSVSRLSSVDKDVIYLYAQWVENGKVILTLDMGIHGKEVQPVASDMSGKFTEPAEPAKKEDRLEYDFDGWYTDDTFSEKFDFTRSYESDQKAYGHWTKNPYPVYLWDGTNYVNAMNLATSSLKDVVSYDSSTNTLILNGYTTDFGTVPYDNMSAICSYDETRPLKIVLADSSNNVIGTSKNPVIVGIYSITEVEISGTGTLSINANADNFEDIAAGIYSISDVHIAGGKISITLTPVGIVGNEDDKNEAGIFTLGTVKVSGENTILDIQVLDNALHFGGIDAHDVVIEGGETTISGGYYGVIVSTSALFGYGEFTMTGGTFSSINSLYGMNISKDKITINSESIGSFNLQSTGTAAVNKGSSSVTLLAAANTIGADSVSEYTLSDVTGNSGKKLMAGSSATNIKEYEGTIEEVITVIVDDYPHVYVTSEENPYIDNYAVTINISVDTNGKDQGYLSPTYIAGKGSTTMEAHGNVLTIGDKKITATALPGYEFDYWKNAPEGETVTVTGDISVTAKFKEETTTYTVTINAGENGKVQKNSEEAATSVTLTGIEHNTEVTKSGNRIIIGDDVITAVANNGYVFDAWSNVPQKITEDTTITASFNKQSGTGSSSSSVTSFIGEKSGNDFLFKNAVVVTKATLPGATSAKITNNGSGDGWYRFTLSSEGFTGNGTLYFQVPLEDIAIKGWTVNDVSLFGYTTKYLSTEGRYAKYSASIEMDGTYTIGFEKDAVGTAIETKEPAVTDTQGYLKIISTPAGAKIQFDSVDYIGYTPQEKIALVPGTYTVTLSLDGYNDISKTFTIKAGETTSVTLNMQKKETTTTPTQTTTKSPFPVLGILAGLGAAAVLVLRRK